MLKIIYNKTTLFTFFLTSVFLLSINVNPNSFFNADVVYSDIIINLIRFFSPIFFLIIFYLVLKKNKINKINDVSVEFKIIFLIYFIIFVTTIFNGISPDILYFINFFGIFIYVFLINKFLKRDLLIINFFLLLFLYFFGIIFLTIFKIYNVPDYTIVGLLIEAFDLRNMFVFQENSTSFSGNPAPNSTGFSRVLLMIILTVIHIDLSSKKTSIILYLIMNFLILILISLQSKFGVLSGIIIYLIFLIFKNCGYKKKIINLIFALILPITIYFGIHSTNRYVDTVSQIIEIKQNPQTKDEAVDLLTQNDVNTLLKMIQNSKDIINPKKFRKYIEILTKDKISTNKIWVELDSDHPLLLKKILDKLQSQNPNLKKEIQNLRQYEVLYQDKNYENYEITNALTTGRMFIWKWQYGYIRDNRYLLFGKGYLADKKIFDITSSNSLLYVWLAGGIICIILFFILYVIFTINIIKHFYKFLFKEYNGGDKILYYSLLITMFLRTLIENSFASLQLDLFLILFLYEIIKSADRKTIL
jgi:hypothetical protein